MFFFQFQIKIFFVKNEFFISNFNCFFADFLLFLSLLKFFGLKSNIFISIYFCFSYCQKIFKITFLFFISLLKFLIHILNNISPFLTEHKRHLPIRHHLRKISVSRHPKNRSNHLETRARLPPQPKNPPGERLQQDRDQRGGAPRKCGQTPPRTTNHYARSSTLRKNFRLLCKLTNRTQGPKRNWNRKKFFEDDFISYFSFFFIIFFIILFFCYLFLFIFDVFKMFCFLFIFDVIFVF